MSPPQGVNRCRVRRSALRRGIAARRGAAFLGGTHSAPAVSRGERVRRILHRAAVGGGFGTEDGDVLAHSTTDHERGEGARGTDDNAGKAGGGNDDRSRHAAEGSTGTCRAALPNERQTDSTTGRGTGEGAGPDRPARLSVSLDRWSVSSRRNVPFTVMNGLYRREILIHFPA